MMRSALPNLLETCIFLFYKFQKVLCILYNIMQNMEGNIIVITLTVNKKIDCFFSKFTSIQNCRDLTSFRSHYPHTLRRNEISDVTNANSITI